MSTNKGVYIPSIDGKDIYLAGEIDKDNGYTLFNVNNEYNFKRFKNVFDYSLDLIDMRKIAKSIFRGSKENLTFKHKGKEYSPYIINVTFKYAVKEFNKIVTSINNQKLDVYIKIGYKYENLEFDDCIAYNDDDDIVGIICGKEIVKERSIEGFSVIESEVINKETKEIEKTIKSYKYIKSKTKLTVEGVRENIYENGFVCDGRKYIRFKRSSGSARVGKCLFIDERLYDKMFEIARCGLTVTEGQEIDLASFEAYIALRSSSIIDTLDIDPKGILVVDDMYSKFKEEAVITKINDNDELYTYQDIADIENNIFDGQTLIDISVMGAYKNKGMVLLRNSFFKSCCFNTNIQKFFSDNNIHSISQLNGFTLAKDIKDIVMITTPSSIKYFKFDKDKKHWFDNINSTFGVVKYDKDTHYFDGNLVQTHYQLLNTLQLTKEETEELLAPSLEYLNALNTDVDVMKHHIKWKASDIVPGELNSKLDIINAMLNYDCGIEYTKIYNDFKRDTRRAFLDNMKKGHIFINGTYATLFGNPYEMLLHSIGRFNIENPYMDVHTIHNTRYNDGEDILGCRSPHVTISNILITKNRRYEMIDRYFNLTKNIVCINSIKENILERLSSADFDSDSMIISNNRLIIDVAKINYDIFKVPTSLVSAKKTKRTYTKKQMCDLDIKTSKNKIGEIINCSQVLNSLLWDMVNSFGTGNERVSVADNFDKISDLFYDICQLDVMSCIEIDKAKKEFTVNNGRELNKIREKYKDVLSKNGKNVKPKFFGFIEKKKGYYDSKKKAYIDHDTAMDYVHNVFEEKTVCDYKHTVYVPFSELFKPESYNQNSVNRYQIKKIKELCSSYIRKSKSIWANNLMTTEEKRNSAFIIKSDIMYDVGLMKLNESTLYELIKLLDNQKYKNIRNILFDILFNNDDCINKIIFGTLSKAKNTKDMEFFGVKLL